MIHRNRALHHSSTDESRVRIERDTELILGVDIGGTKVAAGLVDGQGVIREQSRTPMVSAGDPAEGLSSVSAAIDALFSHSGESPEFGAIGICAPGPLNPLTGVIINPPNLPIWQNYPLADELRKLYKVNVRIDNDANAAALAEAKWGAGRGYRNIFYATIGTGMGTGILFDGKIYHGRTGAAGEGGHIGVDIHGPICNCGKRGCIETMAAGPAIARRARQKISAFPRSLLKEMSGGDPQTVTSRRSTWGRTHDFHGTRRRAKNALCHASKEKPPNGAVAM